MSEPITQNDSRLTVTRWLSTYVVPADHPNPQELRHRLDRAVDRFSEGCAHCLGQTLDPQDPTVWRIRNLVMDFSLDAGAVNTEEIAHTWGQHLATRIQSTIAHGEQSDSILRFSNPAAYLTQFIFDLSEGTAWSKWYYEEFEDLRILSVSQAIRTAVLRQTPLAADVVLHLFFLNRLEDVLLKLTTHDAQSIYEACFANASAGSPGGADKWIGILLELWNQSPLQYASREDNRFHDSLRLFARTASRFLNALGNLQFKRALDRLLELGCILSAIHSARDLDSLIENLALGNLKNATDLARHAGVSNPSAALSFFAQQMNGDAHWAGQAASIISSGNIQRKFLNAANILEGESLLSLFGGVFMLGPSLLQMRLGELTEAASERCANPENAASLLRHLVCVKCLGRARALDSASDPAVRLFSGLTSASFSSALENLNTSELNSDAATKIFLHSLRDQERVGPECIFVEIIEHSDREILLVRDLAHNQWLDLIPIPASQNRSEFARTRIERLSEIIAAKPRLLLLHENFTSALDISHLKSVVSTFSVLKTSDDAVEEPSSRYLPVNRQRLSSLLKSGELEYPYLSLAGSVAYTDLTTDCTLSLLARAAIRHFVGRLSGFESSSPEYLYQNFLSGLSALRHFDNRLEVRMPVAPLSLVLRIAGLQEQKYAPRWLKGREVWLLPPQE
ncbi:MAG: hypothetical protein WAL56_22840 [Candidatus Sulfotelmatobacter sp.]